MINHFGKASTAFHVPSRDGQPPLKIAFDMSDNESVMAGGITAFGQEPGPNGSILHGPMHDGETITLVMDACLSSEPSKR